jgi:excisionase family DNA binding protein
MRAPPVSRLVYSNAWHTLGNFEKETDMLADAKVLTVSELSDYLRVHRSTIYRLLKKGQLPGFKIGSDWRFNVEAIDEWRLHQGAAQLEELRNAN